MEIGPLVDRIAAITPRWAKALRHRLVALRRGRPVGLTSLPRLAAAHPCAVMAAIPAQAVPDIPARGFGPVAADFDLDAASYPALAVIELRGGSVSGPQGWAFTARDELIPECSWYGPGFAGGQVPRSFGAPLRLDGTCLSIASDFAPGNYGHFLLDCLPRLGLLAAAGIDLAGIDHVYCPVPPSRSARRILAALGVRDGQCVWAEGRRQVRADRLLVTSFPGRRRDYPPSTAAFLRGALAPATERGRRIFIRRQGKRRLANEEALLAIAARHGFAAYDFRDVEDEPLFFSQAEMVIGAHGSGLANIVFCQPGTRVLELLPSDHRHPYFFTLSRAAALDYAYIVGTSERHRRAGSHGPSPYDFSVDPATFAAALAALLSS